MDPIPAPTPPSPRVDHMTQTWPITTLPYECQTRSQKKEPSPLWSQSFQTDSLSELVIDQFLNNSLPSTNNTK